MVKKETYYSDWQDIEAAITELSEMESKLQKSTAILNSKIADLRSKYESETEDLRTEIASLRATIEAYCELKKKEFEKNRSREFLSGIVGFRISPPKVAFLNRKYNNNTVMELMKRLFNGKYLRVKEELNKDEILTDYAAKNINDEALAAVGLKVDQDEKFYLELKLDSPAEVQ